MCDQRQLVFLPAPNTCLCMLGSLTGVCCIALHLQVAGPLSGGEVKFDAFMSEICHPSCDIELFEVYYKTM